MISLEGLSYADLKVLERDKFTTGFSVSYVVTSSGVLCSGIMSESAQFSSSTDRLSLSLLV